MTQKTDRASGRRLDGGSDPFVYLDHAATTKVDPDVLDAMLPYLRAEFGNPSAGHRLGQQARQAIERARRQVAAVLGCHAKEVVFTSGGTESINAAMKGIAFAQRMAAAGNHIVTTGIEHHSVLHTCQYLEKFGFNVTYLPPDGYGSINPTSVAEAIGERTVLVSVMLANNEVGTIQPIEEISKATKEMGRKLRRHIPLHTDAVQGPGLLELDVDHLGIDSLSLSAHKFGGPKGSGLLYLRRGVPFLPQESGGGQERQRRSGTENVAGIVGTSKAIELAEERRADRVPRLTLMRDFLINSIRERVNGQELCGHPVRRLANNVHFSFYGVSGDELVAVLDKRGIATSAGSACGSEVWEPSHVLLAMGLPLDRAAGGLRLTFGDDNTYTDLSYLLDVLPTAIANLRARATTGARP